MPHGHQWYEFGSGVSGPDSADGVSIASSLCCQRVEACSLRLLLCHVAGLTGDARLVVCPVASLYELLAAGACHRSARADACIPVHLRHSTGGIHASAHLHFSHRFAPGLSRSSFRRTWGLEAQEWPGWKGASDTRAMSA